MTGPTNETALVHAIKKAILAEFPDAWYFKVHGSPFQPAGIPDILVVVSGHLYGFEVKHQKPGESHAHAMNRVSQAQWGQLASIRKAGGTGEVILSAAEAVAIIIEEEKKHHANQGRETACRSGSHQARP